MEENLHVEEETERGVYSLGTGEQGLLPEPYRQQKALVKYRYWKGSVQNRRRNFPLDWSKEELKIVAKYLYMGFICKWQVLAS